MKKGTSKAEKKQESREMETRCWMFLRPFLEELHKHVDRRLVKTLLNPFPYDSSAIIQYQEVTFMA